MTRLWSNLDPAAVVRNCPASEIEAILRDAVAEIVAKEAECFMLAAGACINPGQHALVGDEHGNSVCTAYEALVSEEQAHSEALAELAASKAREDALVEALRGMEAANEALCATRSQETYLAMIDRDKAQDALVALDDARRNARALLALTKPTPDEGEVA